MDLKTLHKLQDATCVLRALSSKLYSLANAFEDTGNILVAERLCHLAADAEHAHKMVDEGTNESLSSALTASEQATANMLMAAVAMATSKEAA